MKKFLRAALALTLLMLCAACAGPGEEAPPAPVSQPPAPVSEPEPLESSEPPARQFGPKPAGALPLGSPWAPVLWQSRAIVSGGGKFCQLHDFDGDGTEELLLITSIELTAVCQIWGLKDGVPELLLEQDLVVVAGGPLAGIYLLDMEGEDSLCLWVHNPAGDTGRVYEWFRLYNILPGAFELMEHYDFQYFYEPFYSETPVIEESAFTKNGAAISLAEAEAFTAYFRKNARVLLDIDSHRGIYIDDMLPALKDYGSGWSPDMEVILHGTIIERSYDGSLDTGEFHAEEHQILRMEKSLGTVTVYARVLYKEFNFADGQPVEYKSSDTPVIFTLQYGNGSRYRLDDYQLAEDSGVIDMDEISDFAELEARLWQQAKDYALMMLQE